MSLGEIELSEFSRRFIKPLVRRCLDVSSVQAFRCCIEEMWLSLRVIGRTLFEAISGKGSAY